MELPVLNIIVKNDQEKLNENRNRIFPGSLTRAQKYGVWKEIVRLCCSRNTILKAVQGLRLRNLVNYAVESWKCNLNYTSVEPDKMEEGRQENLR